MSSGADVVVIGGSAAGLTAAITARRHYPEKSVLIIRREKQVSIPCGIPYVFGTVGSPEKNLIPDAVLDKNGIKLLVEDVTGIDPAAKTVATASGQQVSYDKLVIATGSVPVKPPIPGVDKQNVFAVTKEVPYLASMQEALKTVKHLVIIGGGFIGIEFADECNKAGDIDVTIVEMLPHCLQLAYDEELCEQAEGLLNERGVATRTAERVKSIEGDAKVSGVLLASGETLPAEAVILGIGVKSNTSLAADAGLPIGPTGAIGVDKTMRTSDGNIFACGDCAEKLSFFGGAPSPLRLASIATSEARIAGANLFKVRRQNPGTLGVWSTVVGDTAFATAGLTESAALKADYDIAVGQAEAPNRHPGGMPGMMPLKVKLVFERRTGLLLGGQLVGDKAAGELVNAISACIQKGMNAEDIATFQTGTHPALTASPIAYQFVNAAEMAICKMC
jgi:NADPH-dependent 2,4-dienoyl-CoA reductase/sulfur reductase-like enzyme